MAFAGGVEVGLHIFLGCLSEVEQLLFKRFSIAQLPIPGPFARENTLFWGIYLSVPIGVYGLLAF